VKPHQRTNQYGDEIVTGGHRAGFDITFSAPKSVSLPAIVGGDERIKELHYECVKETMREMEKFAQARRGGNRPAETTGKLLFAVFQHDAARPDGKERYAAPDLHTHLFTANMTQAAEGKIKPLQPLEIYKCQRFGTAFYRAKLAESLENLGYETRIEKETGAPEIVGISREYILASSTRKREIKERQRALGLKSSRGISGRNRQTKVYDRDAMKARHQNMEQKFGGQAHAVVREARDLAQMMSALVWSEETSRVKAQEAVAFAIENGRERKAAIDMRRLMTDALTRNLRHTTVEDITAEMQAREARGHLIGLVLDDETKRRTTIERMLQREQENIEIVRAGKGTQQPIAEHVAETLTTERGLNLNEAQRAAVEQIVASRVVDQSQTLSQYS
jgi:conjugative relaxase-like TrwC/TraI family protein